MLTTIEHHGSYHFIENIDFYFIPTVFTSSLMLCQIISVSTPVGNRISPRIAKMEAVSYDELQEGRENIEADERDPKMCSPHFKFIKRLQAKGGQKAVEAHRVHEARRQLAYRMGAGEQRKDRIRELARIRQRRYM